MLLHHLAALGAFLSALASFTLAAPHGSDHEIHVFKRGDLITDEDFALADLHQVNATEMFKHSVIKRRGEEDVYIWVDNSFRESFGPKEASLDDSTAVSPHNARAVKTIKEFHSSFRPPIIWARRCLSKTYNNDVGPNAPCTGGLDEIYNWANQFEGQWYYQEATTGWITMVVGGSNTGCNAAVRARREFKHFETTTEIGVMVSDVRDFVDRTRKRFSKVYNGRTRARGYGTMECGTYSTPMRWQVTNRDQRI